MELGTWMSGFGSIPKRSRTIPQTSRTTKLYASEFRPDPPVAVFDYTPPFRHLRYRAGRHTTINGASPPLPSAADEQVVGVNKFQSRVAGPTPNVGTRR